MKCVDRYNSHRLRSLLDLVAPEDEQAYYYADKTGSPTGGAAEAKTA